MTRANTSSLRAALACALMALSATARAEVPISEGANRHLTAGLRYLAVGDTGGYEKAYAHFQAAYADSASWTLLGQLGTLAEVLERDEEAMSAYRGYLQSGAGELSDSERERCSAAMNRLALGSARVIIHAPAGAWIVDERLAEDGRSIINRYDASSGSTELRLRVGRHRVYAELNGQASEPWEIESLPGSDVTHDFIRFDRAVSASTPSAAAPDLRAGESEGGRTMTILGGSALGLGAASAGLGIYFSIKGNEQRHEGEAALQECQRQMTPTCPRSDEKAEAEARQRRLALVSFAAAGALLTTGVLLLVLDASSPAAADEGASLLPWIDARQIGVRGSF